MKTRVQEFIDRLDTQDYLLMKDIGNYIMYSFLEMHSNETLNIMSQREFNETVSRLLQNWDDLPEHKDKCLLRKELLLMGGCLPYDAVVYPEGVRQIAISWAASIVSEKVH